MNWVLQILTTLNRILAIGGQCVNNTAKISHNTWWDIFQINFPENDKKNMINALWWKSSKHLGCFHMLTAKACSETVPLREFLNKPFRVCNFGNTLAMTMIFCFKRFKIWCRILKWNKKSRKSFSFFRKLLLNWELQILTFLNRILAIGSQCVNRHP